VENVDRAHAEYSVPPAAFYYIYVNENRKEKGKGEKSEDKTK
jgi:hypothetical protein